MPGTHCKGAGARRCGLRRPHACAGQQKCHKGHKKERHGGATHDKDDGAGERPLMTSKMA